MDIARTPCMSQQPRNIRHRKVNLTRALGALLWVACLATVGVAWHTVRGKTSRETKSIAFKLAPSDRCGEGDLIFLETDHGLDNAGVVFAHASQPGLVELTLDKDIFDRLTASTQATCRQTPFSVEQAINMILPPAVQRRVAEQIAADWSRLEEDLAAAWEPIITELATAYLQNVGSELEAAIKKRDKEFWNVTVRHGQALASEWPAIQVRLAPILQQHLTPVLSRLVETALADVPKMSIAWEVAKGNNADAFRLMLDWLTDYLSAMPEDDVAEMGLAVRKTWNAASQDSDLVQRFEHLGKGVLEDRELRELFIEIYREAIVRNPQTADFIKTQVLESPTVRKRMYEFLDALAPTAREVAAICLFDANGVTRPEVVHIVRSVGFRRRVSWITLRNGSQSDPLIQENTLLTASSPQEKR